jgi:hypothetical protein
VPAEDGVFLTQVRALAEGDVEAIVRIFEPDVYAREPGVVLTSIPGPALKARRTGIAESRE